MTKRAIFYVDGFNLYHAIADLGKPHLKWFSLRDYAAFVTASQNEQLVKVHYFSALASHKAPDVVGRHQTYLRALKSTGVEYTLGKFKDKPRKCLNCQTKWTAHEEKETDVNIAIQLIADAIDGSMDVAYVISGDSDLSPAVRLVQSRFSAIEFVPIAPPSRRHASELLGLSRRSLKLAPVALERNRLPETITDASGSFVAPPEYALPTPPTQP
jgi:uncharacterized LabA/DUF88 family protein